MNYSEKINKALIEMGFESLTEIQEKSIPLLFEGKDVIGHSHTGTGKTAAFSIPILEMIDFNSDKIQALVLCPTRELAVQVRDEILRIAKYVDKAKVVAVFGGDPIRDQIFKLKKKPQIIVGTPGRTIDHINRKTVRLDNLKFMILDEADEMLKMGFQEDIETIFNATPKTKQTLMFSATMPKPILNLAKNYMNDAELVKVVREEVTNKDVKQYFYNVRQSNKVEALSRILTVYHPKLTLVFCNTKRRVDEVAQALIDRGY
ncbi:unnamed protein product, partial [marine sediment metagenome]